jgi:hypothetical protein
LRRWLRWTVQTVTRKPRQHSPTGMAPFRHNKPEPSSLAMRCDAMRCDALRYITAIPEPYCLFNIVSDSFVSVQLWELGSYLCLMVVLKLDA